MRKDEIVKPLHVLIVEASVEDTELLVNVLRCGRFDPIYESGETAEAMSAAPDRQSWDIAFCAYSMPRFNGMEAL